MKSNIHDRKRMNSLLVKRLSRTRLSLWAVAILLTLFMLQSPMVILIPYYWWKTGSPPSVSMLEYLFVVLSVVLFMPLYRTGKKLQIELTSLKKKIHNYSAENDAKAG